MIHTGSDELEDPSVHPEIRYSAARVAQDRSVRILDVRDAEEVAIMGYLPGSRFLPLALLTMEPGRLDALYPRSTPMAIVCQSGRRARDVCVTLREAGFSRAGSLSGGLLAWTSSALPTCGVAEPDPDDVPSLSDPARFPRVLAACFVASTAQNALEDPMWEGKDPASLVRDILAEEVDVAGPGAFSGLVRAVHRVAEIARVRGFPLEDIRVNTDRMVAALRRLQKLGG